MDKIFNYAFCLVQLTKLYEKTYSFIFYVEWFERYLNSNLVFLCDFKIKLWQNFGGALFLSFATTKQTLETISYLTE